MKRLRDAGRQRGAVAVLVALILVVLIGAAGIALDLGRLFVAKTELQNAADACALAAARELGTPSTLAVLTRAENAGITVGNRHRADFQDNPVVFARDKDVTFSSSLNGSYLAKAAAPADVRYVRCTRNVTGFMPWFMQVLGAGSQSVGATAVAWAQPGSPTCLIPLAMCSKVASPEPCTVPGATPDSTGLCVGQWYAGRLATPGETGSFNWIDYSDSGGGAHELKDGLMRCVNYEIDDTPQVLPAKTGVDQSAGAAWNTRFGLYKKSEQIGPADAPLDTTGYAYTLTSWPSGHDAFGNYRTRQAENAPYQGDQLAGLKNVDNGYRISSRTEHAAGQTDRRLITMPLVDCGTWDSGHSVSFTEWACALMLTPFQGPTEPVALEYLGIAGRPGVPCGAFGHPGGVGPRVPTLVQ